MTFKGTFLLIEGELMLYYNITTVTTKHIGQISGEKVTQLQHAQQAGKQAKDAGQVLISPTKVFHKARSLHICK